MSTTRRLGKCKSCGDERLQDDLGWKRLRSGWHCKMCRGQMAAQRRQQTGKRKLAAAEVTRTEMRNGREFTVVTIPPRYRWRRTKS